MEFVLRDAVTKPSRNNGARHYGPRAKYGARQYGFPPKNEVPGTTPTRKGGARHCRYRQKHGARHYDFAGGATNRYHPNCGLSDSTR
ncbi:MAG: hypothetical protein KatS3mg109_2267 [Pirellulaceae bacterium]|nr:MAG: hypothetical protein KatS3mg109_2267 [Pirellulaceae bacterium]